MSRSLSLASRRAGRRLAGFGAVLVLGIAIHTAVTMADPVLRLYDGLWMLAGAALATGLVGPLVWGWPRERALIALAAATALGAWLPLVVLAVHAGMPVLVRLKGAIFFSSADVIGVALPVGVVLAWLTFKEYDPGAK